MLKMFEEMNCNEADWCFGVLEFQYRQEYICNICAHPIHVTFQGKTSSGKLSFSVKAYDA